MENDKLVVASPKIMIIPTDEQDLWEKHWKIVLAKEQEKVIGFLTFQGEKALGTVPFGIELSKEYRNQGYGTEAIRMMVDWLFHFNNIYEIRTESDRENDAYLKALKKAGFVRRGNEGRIETYSIVKPKTAWTGLYLFIGIILGMFLGLMINQLVAGLLIGIVIGLSIGLPMDAKRNKEREQVTGKHTGIGRN